MIYSFRRKIIMEKIKLDQHHFLEVIPGEYSMDFELKEMIIQNGKDVDDVKIHGYLKWDGCMNWGVGGKEDHTMYHFCGIDNAEFLHTVFAKIWDLGPDYIEHWLDD